MSELAAMAKARLALLIDRETTIRDDLSEGRLRRPSIFPDPILLGCGVLGTVMGLRIDQGVVGDIWRVLIIPAWLVSLAGAMLGASFWGWIGFVVVVLGFADLSLYRLRRASRGRHAFSGAEID